MPKYLAISSDLQLIAGEGSRFLSRSGKDLEVVESAVRGWLVRNAGHPMRGLVEAWLGSVDLNQYRREQKQRKADELLLKEFEKIVRRFLTSVYQGKGWPLVKARQEAAKKAKDLAVKLLDSFSDTLEEH